MNIGPPGPAWPGLRARRRVFPLAWLSPKTNPKIKSQLIPNGPGFFAPPSRLAQRGDVLLDVVRSVVRQAGAVPRERHGSRHARRGLRLAAAEPGRGRAR